MTTHIVATGGGGFSMAADHRATAADRYLLSLTDATNPLVCFVPTASADDGLYVSQFFNAYSALSVRTSVLTLWSGAADAIKRMEEADIFVIGGGNTVNLLALWAAHGVGDKFKALADSGKSLVIGGMAAGAAAFFEGCATDGYGNGVAPLPFGLGLVPGSFCPHYSSEAQRAPQFKEYVDTSALPSGWGADDGAGIHFVDGKVEGYWSETDGAAVYRVEQDENGATVTRQETTPLT
ncbi:MAG: Type 1 glutamine amidotransferase-like domain-containing protein [Dermatophilus congolensis]|nr:Type 1 glutamine amidotransferase-like domain-containing protein [Dermatophilus congolensis]